jgi:3-methylfumaryl-CoA hydratase
MNRPVDLSAWIGREEIRLDIATPALVHRLAATLDHDGSHWPPGVLPPLGHWLCFLPDALRSQLDQDGHPKRGGFLPPVPLPRRMWAGSRVDFVAPIPLGVTLRRRSTIASVAEKQGRSGPMLFVTARHEVLVGDRVAIREEQDLVYREAPTPGSPPPAREAPLVKPDWTDTLLPDATLLFRYSALTFNAHRIHYDLGYATAGEGHAGLVVQGPLAATLLLDRALRERPGRINSFRFRAQRPLIAGRRLTLCGAGGALWACDADGALAMTADLHRDEDQA